MSKRMNSRWMVAALATLVSLSAMAQEDALKDLPGYVDLGQLEDAYGEPRVMINIGGLLLGLATAATRSDPVTSEMLDKLKGVRVNVYATGGDQKPALDHINEIRGALRAASWEPIVLVNEDGERVQVYMKTDSEGMQGLIVMAVDDEEAVFVNLLGAIDPINLGQVMESFNVDVDIKVD